MLSIAGLAAMITVLNEGEFGAWLGAVGVIAGFGLVGFLLNLMNIAALLLGGVYALWWSIAAIKNLGANWDSFEWENRVLAVTRLLIAVALVLSVFVWINLPLEFGVAQDMTQVMPLCGWAGGLAIAAAAGTFLEGVLWVRYCSY